MTVESGNASDGEPLAKVVAFATAYRECPIRANPISQFGVAAISPDLNDCYFLAGLSAIAMDSPRGIRQSIVDFHNGTYGVRLGQNFYRVDNDLPVVTASSTNPAYAQLGPLFPGGGANFIALSCMS